MIVSHGVFECRLQNGYLSLKPHVEGEKFPLKIMFADMLIVESGMLSEGKHLLAIISPSY